MNTPALTRSLRMLFHVTSLVPGVTGVVRARDFSQLCFPESERGLHPECLDLDVPHRSQIPALEDPFCRAGIKLQRESQAFGCRLVRSVQFGLTAAPRWRTSLILGPSFDQV